MHALMAGRARHDAHRRGAALGNHAKAMKPGPAVREQHGLPGARTIERQPLPVDGSGIQQNLNQTVKGAIRCRQPRQARAGVGRPTIESPPGADAPLR
jgi:hypothetical protein